MATVDVKADFYRVSVGNGPDFAEIVRFASTKTGAARTVFVRKDNPVRLEEFREENGLIEGDLERIRLQNIPHRAKIQGGRRELDLEPDEGLGEDTAFLYVTELKVLVLQRNWFGAGASTFSTYFQRIYREQNKKVEIELRPIATEDPLGRLSSLSRVTQLSIAVDVGDTGRAAVQAMRDAGIGDVTDFVSESDAGRIDIIYKAKPQGGSLRKNAVMPCVRSLLNLVAPGTAARRIRVIGESDEDQVVVDLLLDRVQVKEQIEADNKKSIPYEARRELLRRAWTQMEEECRRRFKTRPEGEI